MKKKKIVAILTTIGIFLIPIIQNVISHKIEDMNYFEELKKMFILIINFIKNIMIFEIPIWVILLVIAALFLIIKIYLYFYDKKSESIHKEYEWDKYRTEEYAGLLYTWEQENYLGEKRITNLRPICKCGCDLVVKDSYQNFYRPRGYLVCPNCQKGYDNNFSENEQAVRNVIVFKYNKMIKEYNDKNNSNKTINIEELTQKEKDILKKFYVPELRKYTNRKKAIICKNNAIDLLIERGIIKEQTEGELIDNYTSEGVLYQLTDDALEQLNR